MNRKRPFFRNTTDELKIIYNNNKNNKKILKQLKYELEFRNRPRAKVLLQNVIDSLNDVGQLPLPIKPESKSHTKNKPDNKTSIKNIEEEKIETSKINSPNFPIQQNLSAPEQPQTATNINFKTQQNTNNNLNTFETSKNNNLILHIVIFICTLLFIYFLITL